MPKVLQQYGIAQKWRKLLEAATYSKKIKFREIYGRSLRLCFFNIITDHTPMLGYFWIYGGTLYNASDLYRFMSN